MKVWMQISVLALSAALLAGCGAQTVSAAEPIGIDAAKAAALEDAGVNAEDASFTTAELERKGELEYYDVDFTAGGQSYEYDIDAITGVVIARDDDRDDAQDDAQDDARDDAQSTAGQTGGLIGEAEAKAKALAHAGLKEIQVTFLRAELDRDDGRQVYEVEFYTQDYKEYDYEIDAATGEVLSYDYDAETDFQTGTSSGKELTAAQAKAIALGQVPGAAEGDIREFSTDRDDGRLEYEGEIRYNGVTYEFEIDGYSGAIRSWETD